MTTDTPAATTRSTQVLTAIRALWHLAVVVAVCVWGFAAWPQPWPGLLTGFGFTALSVLIWALFLSPRPVLQTDRFGQGLIELLFLGSGVGAMLGLGVPWVAVLLFGLVGAVLGYVVPERLR